MSQMLNRKQYATLWGVSYNTACKYYNNDCKTRKVKRITVAIAAQIFGMTVEEVQKSLLCKVN